MDARYLIAALDLAALAGAIEELDAASDAAVVTALLTFFNDGVDLGQLAIELLLLLLLKLAALARALALLLAARSTLACKCKPETTE